MGKTVAQKIFEKHLKQGKTPLEKMVDDLGHLKGIVRLQPYDPFTMKLLGNEITQNTVVNSSKSNVIRLIAQAASPWGNYSDRDRSGDLYCRCILREKSSHNGHRKSAVSFCSMLRYFYS